MPAAAPALPLPEDIPLGDPVRGRRPDRARQAGRPGRPPGAGQPGRHAGQRPARPCRRRTCPASAARRRPGIVHRLDKDTSGVMVVAKTERAHRALSEAFAARDLDREYLALVWGLPEPPAGEIEAPIGRHPADRKRMAVLDRRDAERRGKPALTRYATERAWRHRLRPAALPAADRPHPPDPRPPGPCRPPARGRPGLPPPHPGARPGCCRPRRGRRCWPSRARRCTRRRSASAIRSPAQALPFAAPPPPDLAGAAGVCWTVTRE